MKTTPFDPDRRIGTVTQVLPDAVFVNLEAITQRTGRLLAGRPLRGGLVGDFVVVEPLKFGITDEDHVQRVLEYVLSNFESLAPDIAVSAVPK